MQLSVFGKKMQRKIFEAKREEETCDEKCT
jgi:hypothetical protein